MRSNEPLFRRRSGVLLHPTSFPSQFGIGDLGKSAYEFVDFLAESKQQLWQILPLGPTGYGNTPYSCLSSFANNELLIDLQALVEDGYLEKEELENQYFDSKKVDYDKAKQVKIQLLQSAFNRFIEQNEKDEFNIYCESQSNWLLDYSIYRFLKTKFNESPWNEWEIEYKSRDPETIFELKNSDEKEILFYQFTQYIFENQWLKLKNYANQKEIYIIGDIPIYVAYDSADTWANQELFELGENHEMTFVAGCPPDHFSETGQRWGNPIYNWDFHIKDNFSWWINRIERTLEFTDIIRIDHFRGLEDFWRIPSSEPTAEVGDWIKGPSTTFFSTLVDKLGQVPIIAEDLGILSPSVYKLRDKFNFPGMKMLQYAFNPDENSSNHFLPHNHDSNFAVYAGSHDNDTIQGWYNSIDTKTKAHFLKYSKSDGTDPVWDMIRLVMSSVAHTAIITMQDLLGLDQNSRMNLPGTGPNNWEWKYFENDLSSINSNKLRELSDLYGRNKENSK